MGSGEASSFGDLLRRHRKIAEVTQEELAERAHLSVRGISDLERGVRRMPRSDTLGLLVEALGLAGPARLEFEAAARSEIEPVVPQRSIPSPTRVGRPTLLPLVGRVNERAALERHLTGDGPPLLVLTGEPGIGKSRLLQEAIEEAGRRGFRTLVGTCHRYGDQFSYAPLLQALQSYLGGQSTARLRAELQGCAWLVRLLPELAEGPIEPLPDWLLTPDQEQRLMGQAVERFLVNIAGPAGTLLVLDDLQWAGSDALALLTALVRASGHAPIRVVGAYRETEIDANRSLDEMLADLAQAGLASRRRLGPLAPGEANDLLDGLLSVDDAAALDAETHERVLSRAEGVPFFLVSCAQALRDGALGEGVPWDLSQGVRQRVAAMPEPAQEVLRVASVAGPQIPRTLLLRVVAQPEDEALVALEISCRFGLLQERGDHNYEITHDVIREVIEGDLGTARRTTLHHQIALALVTMSGEPQVEAIAHHFARTDDHAEASTWLERAGDAAAGRFATTAGLEKYRTARERAEVAGAEQPALSRLDEKIGDLYVRTGEFIRAREAYAAALARGGGAMLDAERDAARRVEILRKVGDTWERQGEYSQALASFDAAESEGSTDGVGFALPPVVRAGIDVSRGIVYHRQGRNEAAAAAADRAEELLASQSPDGSAAAARARSFNLLGSVALHRGDLVSAEDLFRRGLAIRERIGDQQGSASSLNNLGRIAFRRSDLASAEECFQHALEAVERIGDQQGSAGGWHNLGAVARDRGDLARAEECYRRCLDISERIGDLKLQEHAWHSLGIVAHDRGDLAQADECFERSLAVSDRIGDLHTSAHTWHQWGLVARDRGDLGRAEERVQAGLVLFEQLGDEHGRADCWTTLGLLAEERGDLTLSAWRCRAAQRLARSLGLAQADALATLGQAEARLRAGRLAAASALLDHAQAVAESCRLKLELTRVALVRAELHLCEIAVGGGAVVTAEESSCEALRLASEGGYRREEALALRLLGRCALMRSAPDDAEERLDEALAIEIDMDAVLEAARTRLELANALVAKAESGTIPQAATRLLAQARERFLAAGVPRDLERAKRLAAGWGVAAGMHSTG